MRVDQSHDVIASCSLADDGDAVHAVVWEITRSAQVAPVVIEISETAWSSDPLLLPEDTRHALETDGRAALLKILDEDNPPQVIHCGSEGCDVSENAGSATGRWVAAVAAFEMTAPPYECPTASTGPGTWLRKLATYAES